MKKKIAVAVSLLLVLALSVGGTIAYLTAQTGTITNTFSIGNITLALTEYIANPDYDENDTSSKQWIEAANGSAFHVVPGGEDAKKPVITVGADSEACYLYVCITNTVKVEVDEEPVTVASVNVNSPWVQVKKEGDMTLYRYGSNPVDSNSSAQEFTVFDKVTYDGGNITEANRTDIDTDDKITVAAFAHQSANVDMTIADDAAIAHFFPASPTT